MVGPDDAWIAAEAETDVRLGGVDPPNRVVYTTRYEYPDGRPSFQTHVTVTFEPRGVRRLLTVLDTG